jgi:hypothetical protein
MPEIKNNFLKGKMNKDADERIVGTGEYKDALNIQVGVAENGDAGSVHNVLGNIQIDSLNISGAYSLGTVADTQTDKIYWFIYGTSVDAIAEYDEATDTVSPVLVDATKKILNFPANQITAANIIEGYLIYTDDNSEPKNIDIELFKSGSTNFSTTTQIYDDLLLANRDIQESDITLIKKKPASAPTVVTNTYGRILQVNGVDVTASVDLTGASFGDTLDIDFSAETGIQYNETFILSNSDLSKVFLFQKVQGYLHATSEKCKILRGLNGTTISDFSDFTGFIRTGDILFREKFVRFAYRWKFKNNQYSVMSPFTETVFYPTEMSGTGSSFNYTITKGYNDAMQNTIKSIDLNNIDCSDTNIESVDILYKESNNTNIYIYKTIKKQDLEGFGSGSVPGDCNVKIDSESFYTVLPDNQLFRQYDNVPYRAKAAEIVANRTIFANYKDGLNVIKDNNGQPSTYSPSFNISIINRTSEKIKSIKSGRKYQFGILFEDEYGRQTPVSANDSGTIEIGSNDVRGVGLSVYDPDSLGGKQFKVFMSDIGSNFQFDNRIKTFKYYIKEQSKEYYNILVHSAYDDTEDSNITWIAIPSFEINKVSENDYILLKRKSASYFPVADEEIKFKILSLVGSKPTTLDSTNSLNGNFFIKVEKNSSLALSDFNAGIFETVPDDNVLDLYYETEESYPISEYTQPKTLRWFNCYDFANGIESDRIKDDFNGVTIENQVRVSTIVEDGYKQKHNKYGFIFSSGLFNSRSGVNDINQFNVAEAITKDLNPEYGSIQKIHTRNTDVVTFCEDKVLRILANKDALFNADGNANLTSVNAVLGQAIPYSGEYGISTNPESFASHGYQIYFTDRARNAVLRLSRDGLTVISNYGMSDFFRDKFNLLTASESISFREGIDGWTSRLSFVPETGVSLNGNYYTLKNGELWKHHAPGVDYNNFYGTQYNSTLNFIYNQDPSFRKGFKTLNYEGTNGWTAASIETDQQSGKVDYFINKEGKWFNNIKGIANVTNDLDTKEFSIQGLGNITGFTIS